MLLTRAKWAEKYFPMAKQVTAGTGIFPQILMATAIIESQGKVNGLYYPGESTLAKQYNNYFGIKSTKDWTGKEVLMPTQEIVNSKPVMVDEYFRVYDSIKASFQDYVDFLLENPRYEDHKVFDATTIEEQAERIKAAGYATGVNYANLLVTVANSLTQYNKSATGIVLLLIVMGILFFRNG